MQIRLEVSKETAGYVKSIIDMINNFNADVVDDLHLASKQIEQALYNDDWKFHDVEAMCDQLVYIFTSKGEYNDEISKYLIDNIEFRNLWQDLLHQVGEAMGPFCYAAFKLERFIADSGYDEVIGNFITPKTVRDVVSFYEDRWEF